MSIKNIKPTYKSGYHQSYFKPNRESAYVGSYPIICRSGLEKKFCIYLDNNEGIVKWSSEPIAIKYISKWDNKQHTYYPDFVFENYKGDKVIVEVKSSHQLKKPKEPKKRTKKSIENYKNSLKMYVTNVSKVQAVRKYAEAGGYKFILITEKELKKLAL